MKKILILLLLPLLLLQACNTSQIKKNSTSKLCKVKPSATPKWVKNQAKNQNTTHYDVAIGYSEANSNTPATDLERAQAIALANLANKLSVNISSSFNLITKEAEETSVTSKEKIEISSNLNLNDVEIRGNWTDSISCKVWVKVAIKKNTGDAIVKLQDAIDLYTKANNSTNSLNDRLKSIRSAENLIEEIKFKHIPKKPSKTFYKRKIKSLKLVLQNQTKGKKVVLMMMKHQNLKSMHYPKIIKKVQQHSLFKYKSAFKHNQSCSSIKNCLNTAAEYKAQKLVLIAPEIKAKEGTGVGYIGYLTLHIDEYDVSTHKIVDKDSFILIGSSYSLEDIDNINWNLAIENAK